MIACLVTYYNNSTVAGIVPIKVKVLCVSCLSLQGQTACTTDCFNLYSVTFEISRLLPYNWHCVTYFVHNFLCFGGWRVHFQPFKTSWHCLCSGIVTALPLSCQQAVTQTIESRSREANVILVPLRFTHSCSSFPEDIHVHIHFLNM